MPRSAIIAGHCFAQHRRRATQFNQTDYLDLVTWLELGGRFWLKAQSVGSVHHVVCSGVAVDNLAVEVYRGVVFEDGLKLTKQYQRAAA